MAETLSLSVSTTIKNADDQTVRTFKMSGAEIAIAESSSWSDVIDGSSSDTDVTPSRLDNIDFIIIETDKPITVKLDGIGNYAIPVQTILTEGSNTKGLFVLSTNSLTSIHISVPGTEDASIEIITAYKT
jgi:hypothetical protein